MSSLVALAAPPYKGLAPFEDSELDALLFFGREREREVIVANLLASKLTVLYGPSGVGKSSILRAGVARRLREVAPEADVVVLDEWAGEATLPAVGDEAFLILDQFEEYFLYHGAGPLLEVLPDLLARQRVHVLIALREDGLAALDAFQSRIPSVFANRLRLGHLDEAAARAAILGPLDRWNAGAAADDRVGIEAALVASVLEEVAAAPAVDGGTASGTRIEAPYLQLVMERVWEEERAAGSPMLRESTLERLGGARAIVSDHLARALEALPPSEAEIATHALRFLVTPSRTKIAHSFGDLVGYTDESPVELQAVLERLASQRILRAVAADGGADGRRYEIFHDVLAEPVLAWRREFEARTALAREREASARRNRRLMIVAIGAGCIAAAMIAIAAYALTQRGEAGRQRRAAQVQADLALGQKEIAQRQAHLARVQKHRADVQRRAALEQKAAAKKAARAAKASALRARQSEARAKQSEIFAQHEQRIAEQQAGRAGAAAAAASRNASAAKRNAATARRNSVAARRAARSAKVGELTATAAAELGVDPVQSVRAALAASSLERSPRVEDALRSSLQALRVRGILDGGGGGVNAAVFNLGGSLVATATDAGFVRIFRTGTHTRVWSRRVGSPVATVTFSPDGQMVLAGAKDGRALIWNVGTGTLVHTLPHGGAVLAASFSPDGRFIVTGSADKTLRIWDADGNLLRTIAGARAVSGVAVNPDSSFVVAFSGGDSVARVYSLPAGDLVASLPQQAEVTAAAFSPDGKLLVTTGRRNGYVWEVGTWSQLHLLVGHDAALTDVVFAKDGRVVTTSVDSSARVWNPSTGELIFALAAQHQQKVLAAAWSPDGREVVTASADQTARVWNSPLGSTPFVLAGHRDAVDGVSFAPDGRLVLTASADGTARLWDPSVPSLQPLATQPGSVSTVSYSPDGRLVLAAGTDSAARIWRTDGTLAQTLRHGDRINAASFAARGREVLTGSADGTAKAWRVSDGALVASYAHGAPVRAAVALTGGRVLTAGDDGAVRLWTHDGKAVWSASQGSPVRVAAASSTGEVATGAADGSVVLWRARDGVALHTLHGHTGAVTSLDFSRDGSLLVSGSADTTARIWNAATGASAHTLAGHRFDVTSVEFSPDGKLVLTASVDGDALLWSVASGRTVHRLRFHVATVSQAAFSPDGRWVVTAGPTTAGIWQVRTGDLLMFLGGASGQLTSAGFAPDSKRIVVGSSGGGVYGFDCVVCARIPTLRAQATARLHALRPSGG
jgi:WD40 repeat protein